MYFSNCLRMRRKCQRKTSNKHLATGSLGFPLAFSQNSTNRIPTTPHTPPVGCPRGSRGARNTQWSCDRNLNQIKGNRKLIWMEFKIWMELEGVGSFGHSGRVFQLSHLRPVATAAAGSKERCPVPASNKLWIPEQRQRRCGIPELAVLCVLQHGTPHPPSPSKGVSSTVFGFHLGRRFQLWGASRSFSRGCLSESETH